MQGDLNQKIEVASADEIGTLGTAFNQMVINLKQKIEQLHGEQVKLQASINSLSVGYIMVDRDRNIAVINHTAKQAFCALESSPLATIDSCTLGHIADQLKSAVDLRALIDQCFAQKKPVFAREVSFKNRYLKIFITPIITIGVIGAVVLIDDITEAKLLERSKDEFFSIASHELRTPLTAIRGNTSMIKEFYTEKLTDPELKDMVEDIHESSIRLIGIVNDFLDMSRLEQGKMEFKKESVNIVDLIKSVVSEYQVTGTQKHVVLNFLEPTPPVNPMAFTDKNKTKQVVINLIGNALKFTEHGAITIRLQLLPGNIKVLVSDTGRGISVANQNLLFRKFQQANTSLLTRDTTKGTGLGLYISRLLIEGLKGTIKLEGSVEGKGTTFSFTLPLATTEQLKATAPVSSGISINSATGLTQKNTNS
jgi:signal transduction histidine kinase